MSIRSLARDLGVSPTAVSLALQNSPRVSLALREQVQRAAAQIGHVPNARLATLMAEVRRSGAPVYRASVGIVSLFPEERPWLERPLYSHLGVVHESARQRAAAHGYKTEDFWVKRPGLCMDWRHGLHLFGDMGYTLGCLGKPPHPCHSALNLFN